MVSGMGELRTGWDARLGAQVKTQSRPSLAGDACSLIMHAQG